MHVLGTFPGKSMPVVVPLKNWMVISWAQYSGKAKEFINVMKKASSSLGMQVKFGLWCEFF